MSARCLPVIAIVAALSSVAQGQAGTVDELAGLWKAQRLFGPVARGPLVIRRTGSSYTADMVGKTVPVRVANGELLFELPNNQGKFRGKLEAGRGIFGFWFPPGSPTGLVRLLPVTLRAVGSSYWSGQIDPPEDTFTFYLLARKRPDGTMGAFLRNPDRDLGALWAIDRIVREGNSVKLIAKRGNQESNAFTGTYDPEDSVLTIDFQGRGGKYEFTREVGDSEFYPRGKNPAPYTYGLSLIHI